MIQPSMTFEEMYLDHQKDLDKIRIFYEKTRNKVERKLSKVSHFPYLELFEYTNPKTQNKYILYFFAKCANDISKLQSGVFCTVPEGKYEYFFRFNVGRYKHINATQYRLTPTVSVITNHFIKRYYERMLKPLGYKISNDREIMCYFAIRNPILYPTDLNEKINNNFKKYDAHLGFTINDGICFIRHGVEERTNPISHKLDPTCLIYIFTTFVDKNTLKENQKIAIDESNIECFRRLQREYINGEFTNEGIQPLLPQ